MPDNPKQGRGRPVTRKLRDLIRANYEHSANYAEGAELHQTVGDVLRAVDPATWTPLHTELPATQLADSIAASLAIHMRAFDCDSAVYAVLDDIRLQFHALRLSATG